MSTSKPETSTSSWDIAPNIFKIRLSQHSSAMPSSGPPINDSFSSYSSLQRGSRSLACRGSRTKAFLPRTGLLHRKGRTGPYRLCAASPALLRRTRQKTQFLLRVHYAMGSFERPKVKGHQLDSVDQRFPEKTRAARGLRGLYDTRRHLAWLSCVCLQ